MPLVCGYFSNYKFCNALLRMDSFSVALFKNVKKLSMELIVKKENFSADFKDKIAFVDKDMAFNRMKPSLEIATDEIIDIISRETYAQVILKLFPPDNSATSNDATSNDASSNDATSNNATSNDATSDDVTFNEKTSVRKRLNKEIIEKEILEYCSDTYRTKEEIASKVNRSVSYIRNFFINNLLERGLLKRKYSKINHPNQAYKSS